MSSDSCATAMPSKSTGDLYPRESIGSVVVNAVNMPNVSGELRDIFQMARFSRVMTFVTRLHSESDGLMVSQNVKGTTLAKVTKMLGSQIHGQKFPTEGTVPCLSLLKF